MPWYQVRYTKNLIKSTRNNSKYTKILPAYDCAYKPRTLQQVLYNGSKHIYILSSEFPQQVHLFHSL